MSMTTAQFNDLRNIASLAYGSGLFEGKSGGNGNIGLIRGPNGEPRVFKCLTHSGERSAFEKSGTGRDQLEKASDELKLELKRLAAAAGMAEDAVEALFSTDSTRGLLTRKIVAKVVTDISKANGGDDVWSGVNGAGTVTDTTLSLTADMIDLAKYGDKGFKTMEEAALAGHTYTKAVTGTAAAEQIAAGYVGDEWTESFLAAASFVDTIRPKCNDHRIAPVSYDILIAKPEGLPLARPTFISSFTGHDEDALRPQLFQHELVRLLNKHGDAELTAETRQTIVRQALTAAVTEAWVLKTLFDVAEAKGKICTTDDTKMMDLFAEAVLDENGKLRPEAIRMARDGVRKGIEAQAEKNLKIRTQVTIYLRELFLGQDELAIMTPGTFDLDDDDARKTMIHTRLGLNDALSFVWSELTPDMKAIFAETHDAWQGDPSLYEVPTGSGIFNSPAKVHMYDFWME